MEDANIDYDLESYANQLKYKLENAIFAASIVSDLGNKIGSKLAILYNSISKLNGKIEKTKFNEIVDVANLKSKELNPCLKMLTRDIPRDIEYYAKMEAKEKSINVSNAKYFKNISIKHINSSKVYENLMRDKDEILKDINDNLTFIKKLVNSLYEINSNYNMCQYKVANVANNLNSLLTTLDTTIEKSCNS